MYEHPKRHVFHGQGHEITLSPPFYRPIWCKIGGNVAHFFLCSQEREHYIKWPPFGRTFWHGNHTPGRFHAQSMCSVCVWELQKDSKRQFHTCPFTAFVFFFPRKSSAYVRTSSFKSCFLPILMPWHHKLWFTTTNKRDLLGKQGIPPSSGADIQQKQPHIGIKLLVTALFGCFLRLYRFFSQSESLCICNTRGFHEHDWDFMLKSRCITVET